MDAEATAGSGVSDFLRAGRLCRHHLGNLEGTCLTQSRLGALLNRGNLAQRVDGRRIHRLRQRGVLGCNGDVGLVARELVWLLFLCVLVLMGAKRFEDALAATLHAVEEPRRARTDRRQRTGDARLTRRREKPASSSGSSS